jgi:mannose-6-phosphate isomerase-like protein (cupin superfamily)
MKPAIIKQDLSKEFPTPERCSIVDMSNSPTDETLSIARARVEQGVTTMLHSLEGVDERYIIVQGRGLMEVGNLPVTEVTPGDVVLIPEGTRQRITNCGDTDLIFYCVCTPRFQTNAYKELV